MDKLQLSDNLISLYCSNLELFMIWAFKELNADTSYVHNWHIKAMCEYLLACYRGEIKRLIINIPPRTTKSLLASVAFPMWVLGQRPSSQFMCVSSSKTAGEELSRLARTIGKNEVYGSIFPAFSFAYDQNEKLNFGTTQNGHRYFTTSNSVPTGRGFDFLIMDDFLQFGLNNRDQKRKINNIGGFLSRANDKLNSRVIVIEQRLSHNDLTANLTTNQWKDLDCEHLVIPAIEKASRIISFGNFKRERIEGQLLDPVRLSQTALNKAKSELGSMNFETQFQQNPSIPEGNIVRRDWLKYEPLAVTQQRKFERIALSADTAYKEGQENDFSAIAVFGLYEGKHYLIDMHNVKLIYPSLRKLMVELYLHHKADCILIEDKSSGQSLIQELEKGIEYGSRIITLNVIKVKPDSSKTARLNACTPLLEAGNLIIAEDATWQYLFTQQLLAFPNDKHDDQVDAMTQYLNWKRGVVNIDTMGFFVGLDLGR